MKILKRQYRPGDEVQINKLYKLITNRDRSNEEYRWEWIDTWNGQGNIWLGFDEDREEGDQLIMQYGLIPTPFSFWGQSYLAGKTENCMSHPDCRGTGLYFPHEKEGFEDAQRRFQMFFTTAGNAGKGAARAVRQKLGYKAFDSWVDYLYFTNPDCISELIVNRLNKSTGAPAVWLRFVAALSSGLARFLFRSRFPQSNSSYRIRLFDCHTVPLEQIEDLWRRNKALYGISVDRTKAYLDWRINKNPCFHHRYLTIFNNETLLGYIIFFKNTRKAFRIVDILAHQKDIFLFVRLLSEMIILAQKEKVGAVVCSTLEGNVLLRTALRKSGFLCREAFSLKQHLIGNKDEKSFLFYLTEQIPDHARASNPATWYITSLVKEGRQ